MRKWVLRILLPVVFVFYLIACGKKEKTPIEKEEKNPTPAVTEEVTQVPEKNNGENDMQISDANLGNEKENTDNSSGDGNYAEGSLQENDVTEQDGMRFYADDEGNLHISEIDTKKKILEIPAELNGKKVIEIGPITGPCERITIPDTVTEIYGFDSLICLREVRLSKNLVKIGEGGFKNLPYLENITLPDSLTELEDELFYDSGVKNVKLPDGLKKIGNNVFYRCKITEIILPETVKSIGDYAFNSCEELKRIELPEGMTSIGTSAFFLCSSLESVTLPDSLVFLGDAAFAYCDKLESVTYKGVTYTKEQMPELFRAVNGEE